MGRYRTFVLTILCGGLFMTTALSAGAADPWQEKVTTSPVYDDGVLYVASSEVASRCGHLRAIDILDFVPATLWDAADRVPLAGRGVEQPEEVMPGNQYRTVLTNLSGDLIPFAASRAQELMSALGLSDVQAAEMLVHTVRGRRGGTREQTAGSREDPCRLWHINRSSPILVGRSPVNPVASQRDRVIYAGAEDGMLHAFYVSRWDDDLENYPVGDHNGGAELWAYLPGSFLPYLQDQPFEDYSVDPAVHLDGSPVARELFLDLDGDGYRRWHTFLVATGTVVQDRKSCLLVLDITDPYQPELVWETFLPGDGAGRTRGVNIDQCADGKSPCIYLTTDVAPATNSTGLHALAINLATGVPVWQFSTVYAASGSIAESTPAVPALMDIDGDGASDTLVFGDLTGQLWALDLRDGRPYGDGPVFTVPGNIAEPIGASVTVHDRVAVFGTGGVTGTSNQYRYALYAVEITREGGRLRWSYPLELGEKVWAPPNVDARGGVVFSPARNYEGLLHNTEESTSGRVVALNNSGEETSAHDVGAASVGRAATAPGVVISLSLSGEASQFGAASRLTGPVEGLGAVRILSWRLR